MISKLLKLIGINEIEIKSSEENPELMLDIKNILIRNSFNPKYKLFDCIYQYLSDNKKGKIFLTNYSDNSFNPERKAFLGFFFVKKNSIQQIKKEIYEKGYSFKGT